MQITINGQSVDSEAGISLLHCLTTQGFISVDENAEHNLITFVVEHNKHIVLSEHFDTTILDDGDVLEVLHFVGGG